MGKLIIDGNKVYTVDEACMRRKNLTLAQVRQQEASTAMQEQGKQPHGEQPYGKRPYGKHPHERHPHR